MLERWPGTKELREFSILRYPLAYICYRPLKEQIVYHFKVVKAADILAVFPKLADSGVVKPEVPPEGEGDEKELEEAAEMYDRTVAQAVYTLPTVWPPEENFSLIVNIEKDIDLSRKTGVSAFVFLNQQF